MALLMHEDSITNIKLAKRTIELSETTVKLAETSRDIAAATKEDGAAMKTIAIMTMLFLPATFFAALFSVPSFSWGHTFSLYWALTVPATILVFLIWAAMNYWGRMWKW